MGTRQTGAGKITGLGVATKPDGSQLLHYSHGRKVKYYDEATEDGIEVGTNLLPAAANGEDVWLRSVGFNICKHYGYGNCIIASPKND